MSTQVHLPVLLTGAGFTYNFGGFLAEDMWTEIFNHPEVQGDPSLRAEMQTTEFDFDFEGVYERVVLDPNRQFGSEMKTAYCNAVSSAYEDLDQIIRKFQADPKPLLLDRLLEFLERFAAARSNPGYFFTLNQDLFVERCMHFRKILGLPGLEKRERFNICFNSSIDEIRIRLPNEDKVRRLKEQHTAEKVDLFYVKLHGSTEWAGSDGSFGPVIGKNKTTIIDREPLLKWYHELFSQVLAVPGNRKLVVIGYGFRDPHINSTIADACKHHGLRVYVVDPARLEDFRSRLWGNGQWQSIWTKGLAGYYRWTLRDLFSEGGQTGGATIAFRKLHDVVFGA